MSEAARFAPRYTLEDYRRWQGDWELWSGIAIAMTPSPFGRHQAVLAALLTDLRVQISRQTCTATALSELDWIVSEDTVVRPDVIVICGAAPERHLEAPPALIAEILSDSTRQNDLTYKRSLYQSQRVGTYLIVDPETKMVDHLFLTPQGVYRSIAASDRISLRVCEDCELEIRVPELFC